MHSSSMAFAKGADEPKHTKLYPVPFDTPGSGYRYWTLSENILKIVR